MPSGSNAAGLNASRDQLRILDEFKHVKHYWDASHNVHAARILPGEYYVTGEKLMITTVLGSCISACVRDTDNGIGGMNHFMLPESGGSQDSDCLSSAARYGSYAMEHMINTILANGGKRDRLEIKLFGGGEIMQSMTNVGERNIEFARRYLEAESLPLASEDMGGRHPRKVLYFPDTGRVLMRRLPMSQEVKVCQRETAYQKSLQQTPVAGEIDLF